jgi:hypothetical protein
MDSRREDRIYELQQALADLDPAQWASFLATACPDDPPLRNEILRRQRALKRDGGARTNSPAFRVAAVEDSLTTSTSPTNQQRGPLRDGQLFGSYRIVRLLGRGGMGEVYQADDVDSGRRVALKVLSVSFVSDRDRQRFLREGQLAASLSHPHTVYVFGSEDIEGVPVIVMEFVRGGTLSDRVKQVGPLRITEAVDAILDVIRGLEAAAQLGILHRDVKPSNCFIAADGRVKIGDFGVSIATTATDRTQLTATGTVIGTAAYSSPEQLQGQPLDTRSDIYGVSATLYYLLCGRPPFVGNDPIHVIAQALTRTPESPQKFRPELPPQLSDVVVRCLGKKPEDRLQSYAALAAALEPFSSIFPPPARIALRLVAGGIDLLVLATCGIVIDFLVEWPLGWSQGQGAHALIAAQGTIGIAYFTIAESIYGATLGKRLLGLRVARDNYSRIGTARAIVRSTVFLMALWTPALIRTVTPDPNAVTYDPITRLADADSVPYSRRARLDEQDPLYLLALLLLFVTARRSNEWRAIHEHLSGTTTVADVPQVVSTRRHAVPLESASASSRVELVGPYRVISGFPNDPFTLLASDDRLQRRVWIRLGSSPSSGPSSSRRDLDRGTRFRWLAGKHTPDEHWDAFEYVEGCALVRAPSGGTEFRAVARLLDSLARECRDGAADGTLAAVATDRLWLSETGDVKIADWRIPGAGAEAIEYSVQDTRACLQFLAAVADYRLDATQGGAAPYSIPLFGRRLLASIREESFARLDTLIHACKDASARESLISRRSRAALMLLPALVLVMDSVRVFAGASILASNDSRRDMQLQLIQCVGELGRINDGRIKDESGQRRHAATLCVSALSRAVNWRSVNIGEVTSDVATHLIDSAQRQYPYARPSDLPPLVAHLPASFSPFEGERARIETLLAPTALDLATRVTRSSGQALGSLAVFALAFALLLGDGLVYRLFGITVMRSDGKDASRFRKVTRSLVLWGPAISILVVLRSVPYGEPWTLVFTLIAFALIAGGAIYAIKHPHFGLPERITRTCLVRR